MTSDDLQQIDLLRSLLGDEFDVDLARKALLKHNGNIEAAAAALLDKENFDDETLPSYTHSDRNSIVKETQITRRLMNTPVSGASAVTPFHPKQQDVVIDLTGENDEDPELKQALQLSMEQEQVPAFRKSVRAPDPNWAVVPSNIVAPTPISSDDHSLAQAIEASLNTIIVEDKYEEFPDEQQVRPDRRPMALRSKEQSRCYVALLLQSMFFIPQIRTRISRLMVDETLESSKGLSDVICQSLFFTFAYLDLVIISHLAIDNFPVFVKLSRPASASDAVGDLSSDYYKKLTYELEKEFYNAAVRVEPEAIQERVFHLRYAPPTAHINVFGCDECFDTSCVQVEIQSTHEGNDLLSCLSAMDGGDASGIAENVEKTNLFQASEVIAFQLTRAQPNKNDPQIFHGLQQKEDLRPFRYPKTVFLDQFLAENAEVTGKKRAERKKMLQETEELLQRRGLLTSFEGQDVIKNIKNTLFFYENFGSGLDGVERKVDMNVMREKMCQIIAKLNAEVAAINERIAFLKTESKTIFDEPSLQHHRYDLRAVLVHDGLYGRSHLYSYVNDGKVWWKTMDYQVSEVSEETVLTDETGLHLGAGPYMLLYSRALPEEIAQESLQWPPWILKNILVDNETFLSRLSPEAAGKIKANFGIIKEARNSSELGERAAMDVCS